MSQQMTWLTADELEGACRLPGLPGLRPHPDQDLSAIPRLIERCFDGDAGAFRTGRAGTVIVLGVDGIGLEAVQGLWAPDMLIPLSSTFPSTSVTAWPTALSGLKPHEHGVPGPMHYREDAQALFAILPNLTYHWDADGIREVRGPAAPDVRMGPWPTVFASLADKGIESRAYIGDIINVPGSWTEALFVGARQILPVVDWEQVRLEPLTVVESVVSQITRDLAESPPTGPALLWAHLNFDEYVHLHGFDDVLRSSLQVLEEAVMRLVDAGHTVIAHADHGLVRTTCRPSTMDAWAALNTRRWCRLPPGGAGRVRWTYPHPRLEERVLAQMQEALDGAALVCHRDDLPGLGLWNATEPLRSSVGEVVAIAIAEEFPVPELGYDFEHGSITREEMMVPFAIWTAR